MSGELSSVALWVKIHPCNGLASDSSAPSADVRHSGSGVGLAGIFCLGQACCRRKAYLPSIPSFTMRAGTPTTCTLDGTSFVTTAPAPTMELAPMRTRSMTMAPAAM